MLFGQKPGEQRKIPDEKADPGHRKKCMLRENFSPAVDLVIS
jgi:hypothetical protein